MTCTYWIDDGATGSSSIMGYTSPSNSNFYDSMYSLRSSLESSSGSSFDPLLSVGGGALLSNGIGLFITGISWGSLVEVGPWAHLLEV